MPGTPKLAAMNKYYHESLYFYILNELCVVAIAMQLGENKVSNMVLENSLVSFFQQEQQQQQQQQSIFVLS